MYPVCSAGWLQAAVFVSATLQFTEVPETLHVSSWVGSTEGAQQFVWWCVDVVLLLC
jgi:hypothetical protein